jgi:hypothetical protein
MKMLRYLPWWIPQTIHHIVLSEIIQKEERDCTLSGCGGKFKPRANTCLKINEFS